MDPLDDLTLRLQHALQDTHDDLTYVARGGMAAVFRARRIRIGRYEAVKVLDVRTNTVPGGLDRFMMEWSSGKLTHPNIVTVHDVGLSVPAGLAWMTMEFVEGTLARLIRPDAPLLEYGEALYMVREILKGLDYAHSKGVIHRDLKPSNILISDDRRVMLADFGIASFRGDPGLTSQYGAAGTFLYMSPEQKRGSRATAASDLYSFGLIFHEMLTGSLPVDPGRIEPATRVRNPGAPDARSRSRLTAGTADLIRHILDENPDRRPASAAGVLERLDEIERRTTGRKPASPWFSRPRYWAAAATMTAILVGFLRSGGLKLPSAASSTAGGARSGGAPDSARYEIQRGGDAGPADSSRTSSTAVPAAGGESASPARITTRIDALVRMPQAETRFFVNIGFRPDTPAALREAGRQSRVLIDGEDLEVTPPVQISRSGPAGQVLDISLKPTSAAPEDIVFTPAIAHVRIPAANDSIVHIQFGIHRNGSPGPGS